MFSFLKRDTPQNLVLAPDASIRINAVINFMGEEICVTSEQSEFVGK